MMWRCVVAETVTPFIPWQCESGSSMAPGHEDCDWAMAVAGPEET